MSKLSVFAVSIAAIFIAAISPAIACAPENALELEPTENAEFRVYADFELKAISQPFGIDLYFCSDSDVSIERIKVDATMPAHQHGMNYTPEITRSDKGNFSVSGMFLHMPGIWRLEVIAYQASAIDNKPLLFTLEIKAQ